MTKISLRFAIAKKSSVSYSLSIIDQWISPLFTSPLKQLSKWMMHNAKLNQRTIQIKDNQFGYCCCLNKHAFTPVVMYRDCNNASDRGL